MQLVKIAIKAGMEFEVSELGTLCLTSFGETIVNSVNSNPQEKIQYLKEFEWMLAHPKEIPFELIALCMHHLKWQEFKSFIESYRANALSENNWRAEGPTRFVLEAFEEHWNNKDLFY